MLHCIVLERAKQFFLLHALFRDGVLVKCEIYGEVQVNTHITGVPDLTLSFTNPSILDDVRFHPCVRYRPWESHQILSFVPPDGQFKLMSYRFVMPRRYVFLHFLLWRTNYRKEMENQNGKIFIFLKVNALCFIFFHSLYSIIYLAY